MSEEQNMGDPYGFEDIQDEKERWNTAMGLCIFIGSLVLLFGGGLAYWIWG